MNIDRAIEIETHNAYMARAGFDPENLAKYEARITELQAERERQYQEMLLSFQILAKLTARPVKPSCLRPMSPDEYFDGRGNLREQRDVIGHH